MRVFVTGATGYVGTALVHELIDAGHSVIGLTRSQDGATKLAQAGAEAHVGDIDDPQSLRAGSTQADGVIHLAFKHGAADFQQALDADLRAVVAMGEALAGTDKPFISTSHRNGEASDNTTMAFARRGVRASVISLATSVHGEGDTAFVPRLIRIAREKKVSAYVADGMNRWPAVHRFDAARLYRLTVESAPAGSRLFGVADEGVQFRDIAEVISRHLGVPLASISREEATAHFGPFLGAVVAADLPRSGAEARSLLGWQPSGPTLLADLERGHYFAT